MELETIMAFMIIAPNKDVSDWVAALHSVDPELDIRVWPKVGEENDIEFALSWAHPHGELLKYKNLKCITSMGAGADHILQDPQLPDGVRVTRVVDHLLTQCMTEYILLAVLNHYRQFDKYRVYQTKKEWVRESMPPVPRRSEIRVGIMGLGQLGADAAVKLHNSGFQVAGWSSAPKDVEGVQCFHGDEQFTEFLSKTNILVCLLPLTPKTCNILNRNTFDKLPRGAYLINVARGEHLVEEDLLEALDRNQLSGACLDVFRTEPLPKSHPFWTYPQIVITPHISSWTDRESVAPQIIGNYRRVKAGNELLNEVDIERGY